MTSPQKPRLTMVYGILVALLVMSGVLLAAGEAVWGLLVLAIATLLNVRLLAFRRRTGRPGPGGNR